MPKIVLAVNAGSSSVKISVYSTTGAFTDAEKLAEGEVSGISAPPPQFKYACKGNSSDQKLDESVKDQQSAFQHILQTLISDQDLPEVSSKDNIAISVHRVVHGGDYVEPKVVDSSTMKELEDLTDLAPLHNSTALEIVKACIEELPKTKNVAVFDTQFHQSIPEYVRTIPINQKIAKENKLRKYGFHGISYAFITTIVADYLHETATDISLIVLHLGSGASGCAIQYGKSVDTTMSLTPLDGFPGASRSGTVDPSLVFHYAANVGKLAQSSTKDLHISRAEEILNKESGWKALTGTADFGDIAKRNSPEKKLAFDIMVDRISKVIGSYYVALGGKCNALVFAGGMGEKSADLRAAVIDKVSCLGFGLDVKGNQEEIKDKVVCIGRGRSGQTLICKTDEATQMVHELECIKNQL